jgi:hypothetical protein
MFQRTPKFWRGLARVGYVRTRALGADFLSVGLIRLGNLRAGWLSRSGGGPLGPRVRMPRTRGGLLRRRCAIGAPLGEA